MSCKIFFLPASISDVFVLAFRVGFQAEFSFFVVVVVVEPRPTLGRDRKKTFPLVKMIHFNGPVKQCRAAVNLAEKCVMIMIRLRHKNHN